jgi:hypothetical protein
MASFCGTNFIGEIEAKVAPIIEEYYKQNGARNFLVWLKDNNIECVNWWDYSETKLEFEAVPFNHFITIFKEKESFKDLWNNKWNDWEHSLRYLLIPKEMALRILHFKYLA